MPACTSAQMVFVEYRFRESFIFGMLGARDTGKYAALLCIESLFGTIVAFSNILIISVTVAGWKCLMRNNFYIIVANSIVFTSMKAFVELAFIIPYYILRGDRNGLENGYFSKDYEFLIFNVSVFADYGVLFSSVFIAVNRLSTTMISCLIVWICSAIIPLIFYFCRCQYAYNKSFGFYYNKCAVLMVDPSPFVYHLIDALSYLSYACCVLTMLIYAIILMCLRRQRRKSLSIVANIYRSSPKLRLFRQSFVVFVLYAASIALVLLLTFMPTLSKMFYFLLDFSDVAYAENLLNLSIAAVFPICFLLMSGEMKRILIAKLLPTRTERIGSI